MKKSPLFTTLKPLILASSSPRRQKMLQNLGIHFETVPAHVDETPLVSEKPEAFAGRMARAKALKVAENNPQAWVIGADTIVCTAKNILGKPRDQKNALSILKLLIGKKHQVMTGICLCHAKHQYETTIVEISQVTFIDTTDDILEAYIRTGEPLDKAGAYGIQGIGSFLIRGVEGSCTNVIGLPIDMIIQQLLEQRIIAPSKL